MSLRWMVRIRGMGRISEGAKWASGRSSIIVTTGKNLWIIWVMIVDYS